MELQQIKHISIQNYLSKMGINPVRNRNYYGMYLSPLRTGDRTPSFKVDYNKNLWMDFGLGKGGSIIDLVMKLDNLSFKEALERLNEYNSGKLVLIPWFKSLSIQNTKPLITIQKVQPLSHPVLIRYLKSRKLNIEIASIYCKEVYYQIHHRNYYAVGFENNVKGYELRNPYFKGCTSKGITTITYDSGYNTCFVFEGFIDFLSYLTLKNIHNPVQNTVVLNSLACIKLAIPYMNLHQEIFTFLDNDKQGQYTTNMLKKVCKTVTNQSNLYPNYKDLNLYLCDL